MVIVQHPGEPNPNEPRNFERTITFGLRRDAATGFMAYSERIGPGVVLVHDAYGLTDPFRALTVRLRDEGFTVLAPDLFDGEVTKDLERARERARELDGERALVRLRAAADLLVDNWHPRVGVVGFSMGARLAARLAQAYDVEASVLYYGVDEGQPGRWRGPVLAHFGQKDGLLPLDEALRFTGALEGAGVEVETVIHPEAGHSFATRGAGDLDRRTADTAWDATLDFLHHHLA